MKIDEIRALIRSPEHEQRKKGFKKLRRIKDEDIIKVELIEAMKFDNPVMKQSSRAIRIHACMTLIQYGEIMLDSLCHILRHEKSVEARANALWCIWDIGRSNKAIEKLIEKSLANPEEMIRYQAALAVGYLRLDKFASKLKKLMLIDPDDEVRWKAAWAIGLLRKKKYKKELIQAINDPLNEKKKSWFIYSLTKAEGKGETGESLIIDMIAKGQATEEDIVYVQSLYYEIGIFERLVVMEKSVTHFDKELKTGIKKLEKEKTIDNVVDVMKIQLKDNAKIKASLSDMQRQSGDIGAKRPRNRIAAWFSDTLNIIFLMFSIISIIIGIIGWYR